ncbi:MAG: ATP-grasp domain-containing protein [Candidatus Omnitrophica bacterium]|nr:ATP-grasp domain-containing protein [Candidatus Omnitrophota bacterium]
MKDLLHEKGARVIVIDTLQYPEHACLSLEQGAADYNGIALSGVNAFYVRTVFYRYPPYDLEARDRQTEVDRDNWYVEYAAERERQSHLASWLCIEAAKGKPVINPIDSFDMHYLKPYQIDLLRRNEIPVPMTLVTNDQEALRTFAKRFKKVVYKPLSGGAPCQELVPGDLSEERLERLHAAPVLFQEYIEGENIRVYVMGAKVVSSHRIQSMAVDYRGHEEGYTRVDLPEPVKQMCLTAVRVCRMKFSGIDLIKTKTGKYVFLECNPSPMFLGIVQATGEPLDRYFADYLLETARGRA